MGEMAMPPVVVASVFLLVVLGSLALMAYVAWRGSKPSPFFLDAVKERYDLELSEADIEAYYDLKDKLHRQYSPDTADIAQDPATVTAGTASRTTAGTADAGGTRSTWEPWVHKV